MHAFVAASALLLSACGGGGADSTLPSAAPTPFSVAPALEASAQASLDRMAVGLTFEPYSSQILLPRDLTPSGPVERNAGLRFTIVDGALPEGLELDAASGVVSGRPARAGAYAFEVQIELPDGSSSRRRLTLHVNDSDASASAALGLPVDKETVRKRATTATGALDLSAIGTIVASMPEGSWRKVNVNSFSDAWTPAELRPLYGWSNPAPERILAAWSGFAWDTQRAAIVLYGGGHANYRGNDVYIWRASTMRWERGSLPSEMIAAPVNGTIQAIDGGLNAPASAHTYDNTIYLPRADRVLVLGGAADPGGGHFVMEDAGIQRITGPYLFDVSRANANQVGGTNSSHVQRVAPYPEITGGQMWQNRDSWRYASSVSQPPPEALTNGCSGVAEEGGRDVAYVRTAYRLYRYALGDLATPSSDVWRQVGTYWYGGSGSQTACAFDSQRRVMVATYTDPNRPFIFWNLADPSQVARDNLVTPLDLDGTFMPAVANGSLPLRDCGFKHDPLRGDFKLWCGTGDVWSLKSPAMLGTSGWTIAKEARVSGAEMPVESVGTGILGKWKYVPNLDVFIGVADPVLGNVWLYKPHGWVDPGVSKNTAPSVMLTAPNLNAILNIGQPVTLTATASDSDGTVARVNFYDGTTLIGESTSAPYSLSWTPTSAGNRTLTAVAYDDDGAQTTSVGVTVTVQTSLMTATIQRGLGSAIARDTFLSSYHVNHSFGGYNYLQDINTRTYTPLLRFAIFRSEGGPVPDGATIVSASLALYKSTSYNMTYGLHRMLVDWSESAATWKRRQPGVAWNAGGAGGVDVDYAAAPDATASVGWSPGWITWDVTASVSAMSRAPSGNFGWRLVPQSGTNSQLKRFVSSEDSASSEQRPKLVVTYR